MHKFSEKCQICKIMGKEMNAASEMGFSEAKRKVEELLKNPDLEKQVGDALKGFKAGKEAASIGPAIRTFVLALMTFAPAIFADPGIAAELEMKLKKADPITMEQINQMNDRAEEAVKKQTDKSVDQINQAIKDVSGKEKDVDFKAKIGNEELTAANAYEAKILKSMVNLHSLLLSQLKNGALDQTSYDKACKKLVDSFHGALSGNAVEVAF